MNTQLDRTSTVPGRRDWLAFEPFGLLRGAYAPFTPGSNYVDAIDVHRTENGFTVEIPVVGINPENIEVTFKDDILSVSGKSERRSFSRSLQVPDDIDADQIQAKVEHGLLTLVFTRRPEVEPKRIAISVN